MRVGKKSHFMSEFWVNEKTHLCNHSLPKWLHLSLLGVSLLGGRDSCSWSSCCCSCRSCWRDSAANRHWTRRGATGDSSWRSGRRRKASSRGSSRGRGGGRGGCTARRRCRRGTGTAQWRHWSTARHWQGWDIGQYHIYIYMSLDVHPSRKRLTNHLV